MKPQRTCTACGGVLPADAEECSRCRGRSTLVPVDTRAVHFLDVFVAVALFYVFAILALGAVILLIGVGAGV